MANQKEEFDMDENIEIDLNKQIDLTEHVVLLQRENYLLFREIDKLKTTHKVELEAKEREISSLMRYLQERDNWWKSHEDLLRTVTDELARRQVNGFLKKVDKLEASHRVELKSKEREIEHEEEMLKEPDSRWKSHNDLLCMEKNELVKSRVNELLRKVDKLEATHKIELEAKEREISGLKWHMEELDSRWKSREDLLHVVMDESGRRQVNECLKKVNNLEAAHGVELEAKEREIKHEKQMLKELDRQWKSHEDLLRIVEDKLAKRQINEFLRKVDKLEANHKIELEEKEREIRSLNEHLEEQNGRWKSQKDLLCMTKDELEEWRIKELLTLSL